MLKQILSKFPRKSSKLDSAVDPLSGSCGDNASAPGNTIQRTTSLNNVSSRSSAPSIKRMSSAVFPSSVVAGIEPLLPFKDVQNQEKQNLFISKLNLCCVVFDFSDPSKNPVEKDIKHQILIDLVEYVSAGTAKFSEQALAASCKMFATNLFRVFSPTCRSGTASENDEDEPMFDPAWSHLQIVYEFLHKFIASSSLDAKVAKKYVDHLFVSRLLDLFDSEDPRERDCLKTILHRVYGKFMVHRPFIRKAVGNIFYRFVFETERHNGVAELLEVLGSIISGFALPLKEEHKMFLWRALIPLHKPKTVGLYLQQLTYCMMQFIEKEPKLASTVIRGLLKYWPVTNSQKEVMFLSELEEVLEATSLVEFQKVMVPLSRRIGCCLNSSHFQVAERALFLWNNDHIVFLIAQNRQVILPVIFPYLEKNTRSHWNQAVLSLTLNISKLFQEMDEALFTACQSKYEDEEKQQVASSEKRRVIWERLEAAAASKPIVGNTPVLVAPVALPCIVANLC